MGELGRSIAWVAAGGALGSVARYLSIITLNQLGYSTYLAVVSVNLFGSLLIGILVGYGVQGGTPTWLFISLGMLGGYTTFSAFSLHLLELLQKGQSWTALLYAFCSVGGGLLCALIGILLGRYLILQLGTS